MRSRFQQGLDELKEKLLRMGGLAEQAIDRATEAYRTRDSKYCQMVLAGENAINEAEREIDELSLDLLESADDCDFHRVREIIAKTGRLYEFAGLCARRRGRDPWILPGFASGHIYVGILKAALDIVGLAGGPVRGPSDDLTAEERAELRTLLHEIGVI